MQPDGRLVEHVQRAHERRSERGGQVDPLRLAPGQRGREPVEGQVVEADAAEESHPPPDLPDDPLRDGGLLLRQRQVVEEPARRPDRERRDLVDRPAADLHVARLPPQARPPAVGAGPVAAVAAQEDAYVDLVLLLLQRGEEPPDAGVAGAVPLDHEAPFLAGELRPGHGGPNVVPARGALQVGEVRAVVRLAPRLDGALRDRLRGIRHHQVHVELDDVAEAVARGTGAERAVEREQRGLRNLVGDPARAAFEALAEGVPHRPLASHVDGERLAAAFVIGGLDRLGQPGQRLRCGPDPIDHDLQRIAAGQGCRVEVVEGHGATVEAQPPEPLAPEAVHRRGDSVGPTGRRDPIGASGGGGRAIAFRSDSRRRGIGIFRGFHRHGMREADQQPRPFRQGGQPAGHRLRRLPRDFRPAAAADRAADAGEEQPQVVVDLRGGADRGARVPDAVLLADRDGGTDAVDAVDVRLLHPFEELPGVGRQRLHVAPLPLGVDRVEGQRRLPRAAHAGDDDQALLRERQVDVLEVVRAGAADDDLAPGRLACRLRHACHGGTGAAGARRPGLGERRDRHGDALRRDGNRLF